MSAFDQSVNMKQYSSGMPENVLENLQTQQRVFWYVHGQLSTSTGHESPIYIMRSLDFFCFSTFRPFGVLRLQGKTIIMIN